MKRLNKYKKAGKLFSVYVMVIMLLFGLCGCGSSAGSSGQEESTDTTEAKATMIAAEDVSSSLTYTDSMKLDYATQFTVDNYEDGYALITIADTDQYLLLPEGKEAPDDLSADIIVLQQPIDHIYLVASAVMDMFVSCNALDHVSFTGTQEDDWYIDAAKKAMEDGSLSYAGKYSAPDYEAIMAGDCDLAIENTMIYHTPQVKEQLEKFNIPVMVDNSSYEENPLGRTEWIKLYGLLTGHEDDAVAAFNEQAEAFNQIKDEEDSGKTVAFFYITSDGQANVRKSSDYLAKMINMAGGEYVFSNLGEEDDTASSTMSMTMEEFYAGASDADYIIYNSTIEGDLSSVNELISKSDMLKNFKAVKKGHVYCTTKNLYQSSMELGTIISDIYHMLQGEDDQLTYLYKLN